MPQPDQGPLLSVLGVAAVIGVAAWAYVLANRPGPEMLDPVTFESMRRHVRCDVPTPGVPDVHLFDVTFRNGELSAAVHEAEGSALLRDPKGSTVTQITWTKALRGVETPCTAASPQPVQLSGRVDGAESGTLVNTCTDDAMSVVRGRFSVAGVKGHPCTLWYVGPDLKVGKLRVLANGPRDDLVIRTE